MDTWVNDFPGGREWTGCQNRISEPGAWPQLSDKQIQVITFKLAGGGPRTGRPGRGLDTMVMLKHTPCAAGDEGGITNYGAMTTKGVAACYEQYFGGQLMRDFKAQYPNLKEGILYSRFYGGWGVITNPACVGGPCPPVLVNSDIYAGFRSPMFPFSDGLAHPYAYEDAFAVQFLIKAQIARADNSGSVDSETGDLSYANAPALVWGGYQWASGNTANVEGTQWPQNYIFGKTEPIPARAFRKAMA